MTHHIQHQYDEILNAGLPGLEIHIVYDCESEISFDDEGGEENNRLLEITATVNGQKLSWKDILFPKEIHGQQSREFLALLRESARQALWAKALQMAKLTNCQTNELLEVARAWQLTGTPDLPTFGKPERDFVI